MRTENQFKARLIDATLRGFEAVLGRRALNRLGGFVYWRTRGEQLDDPERNGENRTLDLVARCVLGPRAVALDAGANVGDWTARFLAVSAGGRVLAFEPVAETYRALQSRFAGEPRVECLALGLSDRAGAATMRVSGSCSGSNSLHALPDESGERTEPATLTTGDAFLGERGVAAIDFLKIDVEGHEVAVLRGFGRAIAERRVRFIQWEYNKTWIPARTSLQDVFGLLGPAGYRLCKIRPRGLLCYARYHPALDSFCYSNWLAVNERDFAALSAVIRIDADTASDW
ncbi:MAG: FkbM family methyltransferase [Opitutaceae bacterium]|nr:FkbM family methyltransferase [Opitutaceae bacterium]